MSSSLLKWVLLLGIFFSSHLAFCLLERVSSFSSSARSQPIISVSFSEDGKVFASGSSDGTIQLRLIHSGKLLRTFYKPFLEKVVLAPDAQTLISAAQAPGRIDIWSTKNGELLHRFYARVSGRMSFDLSPDGKSIAFLSRDSSTGVEIRDLQSGRPLHFLDEQTYWGTLTQVQFSSDGNEVIGLFNLENEYGYNCVRIWDTQSGELLHAFTTLLYNPKQIVVSKERPMAALSDYSCTEVRDLETEERLGFISAKLAAFGTNKRHLFGAEKATLTVWSIRANIPSTVIEEIEFPAPANGNDIESLAVSPDGNLILVGRANGTVNLLRYHYCKAFHS